MNDFIRALAVQITLQARELYQQSIDAKEGLSVVPSATASIVMSSLAIALIKAINETNELPCKQ